MEGGKESMVGCINTEIKAQKVGLGEREREKKKSSRGSCRDSSPRPFDHESGALTTELSTFPGV